MLGKLSISSLPSVKFDGEYRVLGRIPSTKESLDKFPKFSASFSAAPLDPSMWQEIDLSWYKPPILNQGSTSSCVGHGSASGMDSCWLQSGRPIAGFSPFFIYGLINGGRDAGAMISDAMSALMKYGGLFKSENPSNVMYSRQFNQSMYDAAARRKLIQAYHCEKYSDICSAISLGFVCPLGITVGSNFSSLDSEGIAPLPRGGGGGHCILGVGLKKHSRYGWLIKIQNSWGTSYGMSGYAYLRQEHFDNYPDAFAIQSIADDPQDNTPNDEVPVVQ